MPVSTHLPSLITQYRAPIGGGLIVVFVLVALAGEIHHQLPLYGSISIDCYHNFTNTLIASAAVAMWRDDSHWLEFADLDEHGWRRYSVVRAT